MTDLNLSNRAYTSHPSGIECISVAEDMTFCVGMAYRYLFSLGLRDEPAKEQVATALFYLKHEANRYIVKFGSATNKPRLLAALTKYNIYDVIMKEPNPVIADIYLYLGVYTYGRSEVDRLSALQSAVDILESYAETLGS